MVLTETSPSARANGPGTSAEALIREARQLRRRRWAAGLLATGLVGGGLAFGFAVGGGGSGGPRGTAAAGASPASPLPILGTDGIGSAHFGLSKAATVAALSARFGPPTREMSSSGCGPRYSEVEWHDLAVEFRLGRFSGYRYLRGGLRISLYPETFTRAALLRDRRPLLATTAGVSLGSTLGDVRSRYPSLGLVGSMRWGSEGYTFYDDARTAPDPATAAIYEIKIGTCGDY